MVKQIVKLLSDIYIFLSAEASKNAKRRVRSLDRVNSKLFPQLFIKKHFLSFIGLLSFYFTFLFYLTFQNPSLFIHWIALLLISYLHYHKHPLP
jgi:hypothetical protein